MAEHPAMRAALLARPGEACDRLGAALRDAGAELVLVGDPRSLDPEALRASAPQAVLVALEPAVEDSLDRFDGVLHDPAVMVIFDEAELAAQRSGWDAARWGRHLAAKLNGHHDVLPPGSEHDGLWQPSPGALPGVPAGDALDIAEFASEAQTLAADVPRDDGVEPPVLLDSSPLELEWTADDDAHDASVGGLSLVDSGELLASLADADADADADLDSISVAAPADDAPGTEQILDPDILAMLDSDADAGSDDSDGLHLLDADDGSQRAAASADVTDADAGTLATDANVAAPALRDWADSGLSLVDPDAEPPPASADTAAQDNGGARHAQDLDALEQRASALSLADTDSYGHGPLRGAVVIEAGLGGPDAVRQLLGGLPETFPRPILVRLQLDGGRYDRLVKQMQRASSLPVALAESGANADPGTVYFLPADLALTRSGASLVFAHADDAGDGWIGVLPATDTAMIFLSGSDVARVDHAIAASRDGALVAGQSAQDCYDSAAASALVAQGAVSGTPAELAERLVDRWPS